MKSARMALMTVALCWTCVSGLEETSFSAGYPLVIAKAAE